MRRIVMVALVALSACAGEAQWSEVVVVECEPQMGMSDCRTVVDINGARYGRLGTWGTPGDSVLAQPYQRRYWRSP